MLSHSIEQPLLQNVFCVSSRVQLHQFFIFQFHPSCELLNGFTPFLAQLVEFLLNSVSRLPFSMPHVQHVNDCSEVILKSDEVQIISSPICYSTHNPIFHSFLHVRTFKPTYLKHELFKGSLSLWNW